MPVGLPRPEERLLMIVGAYGSGKTEIVVNLAIALARAGRSVQVADLDLVNPYFRCREARRLMEAHGVRVVVPPGAQAFADLPIVLPEIRGMLRPPGDTLTIFDVGGDDVGARSLSAFRPAIPDGGYQLWQVLNARRPFTRTVAGCVAALRSIEAASRLAVTGLVANAHLMEHSTTETVLAGWELARDVGAETGLPVRAAAAMGALADAPELARIDAPLLRLERHMLPPWMVPAGARGESVLRARRPAPIGTPAAHFGTGRS